jgi:hypothetical protein
VIHMETPFADPISGARVEECVAPQTIHTLAA